MTSRDAVFGEELKSTLGCKDTSDALGPHKSKKVCEKEAEEERIDPKMVF